METFVNDVIVPFCCHFVALGNRLLLHSHIYIEHHVIQWTNCVLCSISASVELACGGVL